MAWVYLFLAGLFEIVWAVSLKNIDGLSKPLPIIVTIVGMAISFTFLSLALKNLPIGTAYAIWTGIGAVGVAIYGIIMLGESANLIRIICLLLIVSGIIGLKLSTK
ncbi:quaternary ammonium compound efflux SMR transporter SugE [Silvanigrella paludirubra]|jgi:quaternary ammonium compound-resistance protein SugE|uniref:Guanidinium exporter n=1 Tax=Silvanigrella paludirubra TaxID=2499159 RepID=A0A6N6VUM8_9BACT|nr:quaternary ammonium compound efflux SMR transporter SugE [Silvanigrella paludirubra]KAB8038934.1 quaternary ammonium compound efflux SMR transporter SugE [Silvanigrella paludirubra]